MKLSNYLLLLSFLSSPAFSATCPPVKTVNEMNIVRSGGIRWTAQSPAITRFKGAFHQGKTNRTSASLTCTYVREDNSILNLKLPNNLINRLNKHGDNWNNFYSSTLYSCDGSKISSVEDCSFTLKN